MKERERIFESSLIKEMRAPVFKRLAAKSWCSFDDDPEEVIVLFTFERCGIIANECRDALNDLLENRRFETKHIGGHYMIKSKATGLLYDMVSYNGCHESSTSEIAYSSYLKELRKKSSTRDELIKMHREISFRQDL